MSLASYAATSSGSSSSGSSAGGRTWVLDATSLLSLLISNTAKPDNGSSYSIDRQQLNIGVGYNTGKYEFGPSVGFDNINQEGSSSKAQTIGGYFRYNFVSNLGAVNLIPFAQIALESKKIQSTAGNSDQAGWTIAGGATWFPLNNFIGLNGWVGFRNTKTTGDVPGTVSGFALGTSLNIYF